MESKINLTEELERAIKGEKVLKKITVDCFNPNTEIEKENKILIEIEFLSQEEISQKPAGPGRSFPNMNPYLPDPSHSP